MNTPTASETMDQRLHINGLEKKITALSDALAHLSSDKDLRELLLLIKQPGWTTPAELRLSEAMLDGIAAQVKVVADARQQFIAGARLVGR